MRAKRTKSKLRFYAYDVGFDTRKSSQNSLNFTIFSGNWPTLTRNVRQTLEIGHFLGNFRDINGIFGSGGDFSQGRPGIYPAFPPVVTPL